MLRKARRAGALTAGALTAGALTAGALTAGALSASHAIGDCHECEVLHLREVLEGEDYELALGYYVLREVIAFYDDASITFGILSQAGEDEDGRLVADGDTHILPGYALHAFVGTGIRAREAFIGESFTGEQERPCKLRPGT